ncbi:MAG: hypothetical protein LUC47_11565 [Clostridiales bacterium]|nr:hypothetical protein [Clostridiales bacterium]
MFENIKKRLDDAKKTVDIYDNGDFLPPVDSVAFGVRIAWLEILGAEECVPVFSQAELDQILSLDPERYSPEDAERIRGVQQSIREYLA